MSEQDAAVTDDLEIDAEAEKLEVESEEEVNESEEISEDAEPSESSPEKEKDEPKGVQKRIDELTKNWRETERELKYWREQAMNSRQIEPEFDAKTLADFDYDEDKFAQHVKEQALHAARRSVSELYSNERSQMIQSSFINRESDFSKEAEDYFNVTRNPSLSLTQDMVAVAQESENGPAILYYLGKNPDIALQLSRLPITSLGRELGKIEAKLSDKPKKPSVSKAPPPTPKIEAVQASTKVRADLPDSDSLSTEEWLKRRNKQLKR